MKFEGFVEVIQNASTGKELDLIEELLRATPDPDKSIHTPRMRMALHELIRGKRTLITNNFLGTAFQKLDAYAPRVQPPSSVSGN